MNKIKPLYYDIDIELNKNGYNIKQTDSIKTIYPFIFNDKKEFKNINANFDISEQLGSSMINNFDIYLLQFLYNNLSLIESSLKYEFDFLLFLKDYHFNLKEIYNKYIYIAGFGYGCRDNLIDNMISNSRDIEISIFNYTSSYIENLFNIVYEELAYLFYNNGCSFEDLEKCISFLIPIFTVIRNGFLDLLITFSNININFCEDYRKLQSKLMNNIEKL